MKPTKQQPIKARHAWRKDDKGNPLEELFSLNVFNRLSVATHDGKNYPRQGWEVIDQYGKSSTPPEANSGNDESGSEEPSNEEAEKIAASILEGNDHSVKEVQSVIKALELDVKLSQPKSELLKDVADTLRERQDG